MIFGFNSPRGRDTGDPLCSVQAAAEFLRHQASFDTTVRSDEVIDALVRFRSADLAIDVERGKALLAVDTGLVQDHWTLLTRCGDSLGAAPARATKLRQIARERSRAFIAAYQRVIAVALTHAVERRWQPLLPGLFAGGIRAHGHDLALNLIAGEPVAPAVWSALHALYLKAAQLGIARMPASLGDGPPDAAALTIEHEYVHALLVDRLRTGNLASGELVWAIRTMHPWSHKLVLQPQPLAPQGFWVNFDGSAGLQRRNGPATGSRVGYLDTAPVAVELEHTIAELSLTAANDPSTERLQCQQQIAVLEKIRPALAPRRSADLRQQLRVPAKLGADVCIGLARIAQSLLPAAAAVPAGPPPPSASLQPWAAPPAGINPTEPSSALTPGATAASSRSPLPLPWADCEIEEIVITPVEPRAWVEERPARRDVAPGTPEPVAAALATASPASSWRIDDRSVSGLRVSALVDGVEPPRLGTLIAVLPEDGGSWILGAIRRTDRSPEGRVVLGVGLLARRATPLKLRGHRAASADLGFTVDGVDVAALGPSFDGLYLPLSGLSDHPDQDLNASSLILPALEFQSSRQLLATTAHADHSVTLGDVLDQRADWCRVRVALAQRLPRE